MQVQDIMTRDVQTVAPDAPIQEAAAIMLKHEVGALPVTDGNHVVGFLTDRDIVVRATAAGLDPTRTPVRQAMTRGVVSCYDENDVSELARKMETAGVRRLVVLNSADHLAGIVSIEDLAVRGENPVLTGEIMAFR